MKVDPNKEPASPDRLTIADVAAATGLTPSYLRRLARDGSLAGEVLDDDGRGAWTFNRSEVEQWIQARRPVRLDPGDESDQSWVQDMLLAENASLRLEIVGQELVSSAAENRRLVEENRRLSQDLDVLTLALTQLAENRRSTEQL